MFERIIEIIVYVMSELKQKKQLAEIDLRELEQLGYTNSEISTAFSWLVDRIEFDETEKFEKKSSRTSFRILHEAEKELFSKTALGELVQFTSLGILNNEHIEQIIEKALVSGMNYIDSGHLKTFVAYAVFNAHSNAYGDARIMLQGGETIN